jgi:5-methylcytosine-specific restriction endonuclease McrA
MASKAAPSSRDDPGEPGEVTGLNRPENGDFPALGVFAPKTPIGGTRSGAGRADLSEVPIRSATAAKVPVHRGNTAGGLSGRVLVLNASFEPINVCTVRRAIVLILKEKAEMVDDTGFELHAEKVSMTRPSVIRLVTYVRIPFHSFRRKITRRAVFARDDWQCQYCGRRGSLTMDHIVPRSKGGDTSWDNVVACCAGCNRRKGDRSVNQAGMRLLSRPRTPHPTIFIHVASPTIPSSWQPYVPSPTQSDTGGGGTPAEAAA